ncbi:hypothetical protein ABTF55_21755, partial [Acinetobacter baumannii]
GLNLIDRLEDHDLRAAGAGEMYCGRHVCPRGRIASFEKRSRSSVRRTIRDRGSLLLHPMLQLN